MNLLGLTEKMSNFIIRPPRTSYEIRQLGSPVFNIGQTHFIRQDFRVNNYREQQIVGSYYKPYNYNLPRPTIVFLHGNSSSRVSVRAYLQQFLPKFNLVAFDFAGSGQSQGNYTTLGYEEKQDVQAILNFLTSQFSINQIILWGRSMGAVTAILYAAKHYKKSNFVCSNLQYYNMKPSSRQIKIKALVLDSPFSDLQKLMKQKGADMFPYLPNFLVDLQIDQIQRYIQNTIWESQKTDFNLKKLKPKDDMKKMDPSISLFFITAKNDKIIDYHHTIELYREANSQTKKQIEIVNGGHNDFRPIQTLKSIRNFLLQTVSPDFISSQQIQERSCSSKESQYLNLNNKAYFLKFKLKKQKDQAKIAKKNSNTKILSRVLQYQKKQRPRKKGISLLSNPLQTLIRSPKQFPDETTSIQSCIQPANSTLHSNKCEVQSVRSNILDQNQIRHKRRYLNKINQEMHCSQSKKKSRDSDQSLNLRTLIKKKYQNSNSHFQNYVKISLKQVKNMQISSNSCKNLSNSFQKGFRSQYPHYKNQDSQPKVKCSFKEKKLAIINPRINQPQHTLYNGYKHGRANNNNYSIDNADSFCSLEKQQNKKFTSSYKMISDFQKFNESKQTSSRLHQSYKQLCSTLQSSYKIESKGQNPMVHSQQIY